MSKISLKIKKQKSIFENQVFNEKVNEYARDLYMSDILSNKTSYSYNNKKGHSERKVLSNWIETSKNSNVKVEYSRTELGYGRVFPENHISLGVMKRTVRSSITFDKYIDIDMVNAHPTILLQICKSNKIKCSSLEEYVNNRDKYLNTFMKTTGKERDIAKKLMLELLFGNSIKGFCKSKNISIEHIPKLYFDIEKERDIIVDKVKESNPKFTNAVLAIMEENKKTTNENGTILSFYLQEFERRILESVYSHLVEKNIIVNNDCILCYDGIMIMKERYYTCLLVDLNEHVKNETKFNINFDIKPIVPHYKIENKYGDIVLDDDKLEVLKAVCDKCNVNTSNTKNHPLMLNNLKNANEHEYKKYVNKYLSQKINNNEGSIIETTKYAKRIDLNQRYLMDIKRPKYCNTLKFVESFFVSNSNVLTVKSPYGTGKTTLVSKLISKYKKILFITYRVTLALDIQGVFGEFTNYINGKCNEPKQILQMDSLIKLSNLKYDVIILDECEGIMSHLSSKTLTDQHKVFSYLNTLCKNAQKVIALDGDLADRSMVFLNSIQKDGIYYIHNTYQTKQYKFKCHNNAVTFNRLLDEAFSNDEKSCVIGTSKELLTSYHDILKGKYHKERGQTFLLYTGGSSDIEKRKLVNVYEVFKGLLTMLFYNSAVESGVSFDTLIDAEKFVNCFIILKKGTCSQRVLSQMFSRVRDFKNTTVHVFLNDVPYSEFYNDYYNFNEVKLYYNNIRDVVIKTCDDTIETDENGDTISKSGKLTVLDTICCYNFVEMFNKNEFMPLWITIMTDKGHTFEYVDNLVEDKKNKPKNEYKTSNNYYRNIMSVGDVSCDDLEDITKRINGRVATSEDKVKADKYWLEKITNSIIDEKTTEKQFKQIKKTRDVLQNMYRFMNLKPVKQNKTTSEVYAMSRLYYTKEIANILDIDPSNDEKTTVNTTVIEENYFKINTILKDNKQAFNLDKNFKVNKKTLIWKLRDIFTYYGMSVDKLADTINRDTSKGIYEYDIKVSFSPEHQTLLEKRKNVIERQLAYDKKHKLFDNYTQDEQGNYVFTDGTVFKNVVNVNIGRIDLNDFDHLQNDEMI